MRIAEEFLARQKIEAPLLRIVDNGMILLKEKSGPPAWRMILITPKASSSGGPSLFRVQIMRPQRHNINRVHFDTLTTNEVEWDAYEEYFTNLINNPPGNMRIVKDNLEIALTLWEMFVYCHDAYLVSYASHPDLCTSIDNQSSMAERQVAYTKFSNYLQKMDPSLFDVWRKEILHYARIYCHWLSHWYVEQ